MAKIIIIGSYADSLINFRGDLIAEMRRAGHTVIACAPNASAAIKRQLTQLGVCYAAIPIERTGLNPAKDLRTFMTLFSLFKSQRPDIVLAYTVKPVIYGALAGFFARVQKTASIITGLGYALTDSGTSPLKKLIHGLYAPALRCNTVVFFQNRDDAAYFIQHRILNDAAKAVVLNGSGVNTDRFKPAPFPNQLSFLMIARLLTDKGVREYAGAAEIIKRRHPEILFHLVGWLDSNPACIRKSELDDWTGRGIIRFWGKLDDVRPAIAAASVYVLPSYREGTPRTVLEAMAMARPIITTDAPGCRQTVSDGQNGFLVPVKNVGTLVDAMNRFIENPELIARMGEKSRLSAQKTFDVRKVNATLLHHLGLNKPAYTP